jgi:hypothetical protein
MDTMTYFGDENPMIYLTYFPGKPWAIMKRMFISGVNISSGVIDKNIQNM